MHTATIAPTGIERRFGDDEIIVSKTDPQGRLTYVNDVFLRVSGYEEQEIMGRPHNVIRHPDMPRCVFGLLWDTIRSGQEIFAYVVNLAADGAHYWVLAHVTPTFGPGGQITGYHSNRRTPARGAIAAATTVYRRLREEEQRHTNPVTAMAASTALLGELLSSQGLDHDRWVWSLEEAA